MTPGLAGMKYGEGAIPKDSSKGKPTFQDYTSKMMTALNNPWIPRSKKTATPTWSAVPPLVYCYLFIWKSILIMSTHVGDQYTRGRDRSSPWWGPVPLLEDW